MPPRRRKATNDDAPTYQWSYKVTLSCAHNQFKVPPLPNLGDTVRCGPCQADTLVVAVDGRELHVVCSTHGIVSRHHLLATITAECAVAKHNIRENKGRCHAKVIEAGRVYTAEHDSATDMRTALRDQGRTHGTLS